jgi:hypothetical protein
MPSYELLSLDLRASLEYEGLENPPLSGAPLSGVVLVPGASGEILELGLGADMAEGEEEIFLFDELDLVDFDPDDGPRLRRPLSAPRFYGRRPAPRQGPAASASGPAAKLEAGTYSFMQWRPREAEELEEGLEWFARESWWERTTARGPYILRRVREDSRLATQVLRRLSPSEAEAG